MLRIALFLLVLLMPLTISADGPVVSSASFLAWDYDLNAVGVDHFAVYLSRTPGIVPDGVPTATVPFPTLEWPIVGATGQWHAVITAVTVFGTESAPSNEIPFVVDVIPDAPASLRIEK